MTCMRRLPQLLIACCVLLLLTAAPESLFAQASLGSGRLEGNVADATGALVPGATVTARNVRTGIATTQPSDANGHFIFLSLRAATNWKCPSRDSRTPSSRT